MRNIFKKEERLTSRTEIKKLFDTGEDIFIYPFRIFFTLCENNDKKVKALFSVPKKSFKKAVDRNLIKRRCKEAYRLHKNIYPEICKYHSIGFIYIEKRILSYREIEKSIEKILKKMAFI